MKKPARPPAATTTLPFVIDAVDPLGQGVFRDQHGIGFIGKTLPGETGQARVLKASKGVRFARYETLSTRSAERIEPECVHFGECPGCHYLHTSYTQELAYKQQALYRLMQKTGISASQIEVIAASQRLGYRNRIQLHYRGERLGLIDGLTDTLVEIPACRVLREELQSTLNDLYHNRSWAGQHGRNGHCELYLKNGETSLQWNQPYAHGGFTQVFDEMNRRLCAEVAASLQQQRPTSLLDLFAGDGNLSNDYAENGGVQRLMVDAMPNARPGFVELDLFADDALQQFRRHCPEKRFDTLLLDPPRKGFAALNDWVEQYRPTQLIYVSCNPATLARDLQNLSGKCRIQRLVLLDLFPGTYHFETLVVAQIGKTKK